MAEQLSTFEFGRMRHSGSSWADEYLEIEDGETEGAIWKLTSEDSPSGTAGIRSMQTNLANMAKRRGVKVRTNVIVETLDKGKGQEREVEYLVIQAFIPDEEDEE